MTTENTIFKLQHGYILLEDLESWYTSGLLGLEDRIRVYEDDGKRMGDYKISTLINIYGDQFPFRRIPLESSEETIQASVPAKQIALLHRPTTKKVVNPSSANQKMPLLDKSSPNDVFVSKAQFLRILNECSLLYKKNQTLIDSAKEEVLNWKCSYCSSQKIFKTKLDVFRHILEKKHKKKMKCSATLASLKYWKKWAESWDKLEITVDKVLRENDPRVPLLDFPVSGQEVVTKEEFIEVLDECRALFKRDRFRFESAKKEIVEWKCNYCCTPTNEFILRNKFATFRHVFKIGHRNKMNYTATASDLEFWKKWAESWNDPGILIAREVAIANNPRVPLLDFPLLGQDVVTREEFIEILDTCRYLFQKNRTRIESAEKEKVDWRCNYCSTPTKHFIMRFKLDTFCHVLKNKHLTNMNYTATASDLEFWKKWAESWNEPRHSVEPKIEDNCEKEGTSTVTIANNPRIPILKTPKVSVVKPSPTKLQDCQLPLFLTNGKIGHQKCVGPRNSQLIWMGRLIDNPGVKSTSFLIENIKCGICNINMSRWRTIEVARHAFSVDHLYKLKQTGTEFYVVDFQYWTEQLVQDNSLIYPTVYFNTPSPLSCEMGGLRMMECSSLEDEFINFTPEELKMIENVDELKVESRIESLLRTFGGCVYCNTWLVTGMQVIQHYSSNRHLSKIRERHPVNRTLISLLMSFVKQCQKDISPSPKPKKINAYLSPTHSDQQSASSINDVTFPLFVTKSEMKVRSDESCIGPTIVHIDFIRNTKLEDPEWFWPFVGKLARCGICKLAMPEWSILDVAKHAFSVEHLDRLSRTDTQFYVNDFDWWIFQLTIESTLINSPSELSFFSFLGLRREPGVSSQVFTGFSREEEQMISNLDKEKVKYHETYLLRTFGGCVNCKEWLLTGMEVLEHYTSDKHFDTIRKQQHVCIESVDSIMAFVRSCQKEPSKCCLM